MVVLTSLVCEVWTGGGLEVLGCGDEDCGDEGCADEDCAEQDVNDMLSTEHSVELHLGDVKGYCA